MLELILSPSPYLTSVIAQCFEQIKRKIFKLLVVDGVLLVVDVGEVVTVVLVNGIVVDAVVAVVVEAVVAVIVVPVEETM